MRFFSMIALAFLAGWSGRAFAETERTDTADAGTVVLVWTDATFYAAPSDSAVHGQLLGLKPDQPARSPGDAWTLRERQSLDGGWVEVENLSDADDSFTCASHTGPFDLEPLSFHAYVRRDDLAPATTRQVRVAYPDGSAVLLSPGVPVGPGAGRREVRTPELDELFGPSSSLLIQLAPSRIASEFPLQPFAPARSHPSSLHVRVPTAGGEVTFAGRKREIHLHELWLVRTVRSAGGNTLVELPGRCSVLQVWIPTRWLEPQTPGIPATPGEAQDGCFDDCAGSWRVRRGAQVVWPDGHPLAEVRQGFRIVRKPVRRAGRLCFPLAAGGDPIACFADGDVEETHELFPCCSPR